MKKICVIGSLNIDMIVGVDRFPLLGESMITNSFDVFIGGGKGANQAVALGRLGADVRLVGKLGDKLYGNEYKQVLEDNNVKHDTVVVEKDCYPGIAFIPIDKQGNNKLFVYPGANALLSVEYIESIWEKIAECDIFLLQLEIPLEINLFAAKRLKAIGKTIILDPAPAQNYSEELFPYIDYITPNEIEIEQITGIHIKKKEDYLKAYNVLRNMGIKTLIAKAGKQGSYIVHENSIEHIKPFKVKAIDTTAAGDSFNAGFAYALSNDKALIECAVFANKVGALSTTAIGAQSAMPTLREIEKAFD